MLSGFVTPWVYCQRVPSSVRIFLRSRSRFSAVGDAQYWRIGPQASPRPSSYAFPFWVSHRQTKTCWGAIIEHIKCIAVDLECLCERLYRHRQCIERVRIFSFGGNFGKSETRKVRRD